MTQGANRGGLGGKRENAGRKKGTPNKITRANIEKAQASGPMPLDIILKQMRKFDALAEKAKNLAEKKEYEDRAHERAKDAAPYLHHRLQSMTVSEKPLDLSKLTDAELLVFRDLRAKLSPDLG
jgi:hypothetical protein